MWAVLDETSYEYAPYVLLPAHQVARSRGGHGGGANGDKPLRVVDLVHVRARFPERSCIPDMLVLDCSFLTHLWSSKTMQRSRRYGRNRLGGREKDRYICRILKCQSFQTKFRRYTHMVPLNVVAWSRTREKDAGMSHWVVNMRRFISDASRPARSRVPKPIQTIITL